MKISHFNEGLLSFIEASPSPYHAVKNLSVALEQAGFEQLYEREPWDLEPDGRYYVTRNGSSLIAFTTGDLNLAESGLRMVGAHTDSPCLKVKPTPEIEAHGYHQIGVEVYGGVLLNPWFDRDLSIAGKLSYQSADDLIKSELIDFEKPMVTIPSLAIHLDRKANKERSINAQTDITPILLNTANSKQSLDFTQLIYKQLQKHCDSDVVKVLDYDLCLYDTQPPALTGLNEEFISSARLDNLLSCYLGLVAMMHNDGSVPTVLICNDHEEVGSRSSHGANGPFLQSILMRIMDGNEEALGQCLDESMLISCDNAHGIHPNFASKHDGQHTPILNKGPVIKYNASQSYATNHETASLFRFLCDQAKVKPQSFVMRNDMACGSTIGPITAAKLGVRTIDVGAPQWAMHSIREIAGTKDAYQLYKVIQEFFQLEELPVERPEYDNEIPV